MGNLVSTSTANTNTNTKTKKHYLTSFKERTNNTKFEHLNQYNHEFAKLFSSEGIKKTPPLIPIENPNINLNKINEKSFKGVTPDLTVSATSTMVEPSLINNMSEILSDTSETMKNSELNKKYNVHKNVDNNVDNVANDSETTVNNTSMFNNIRTEDLSATSYNNKTTTENLETTTTIEHNFKSPVKNNSVMNIKNLNILNNIESTISETSTILNNINTEVSATSPFINNDEYQKKYINQEGGGDSSSSSSSANSKNNKLKSSVLTSETLMDMSDVLSNVSSPSMPSMRSDMSEMAAGSYLSSSAHTDGYDSSSENATTINIGNKNQLSDSINTSDINMISIDE